MCLSVSAVEAPALFPSHGVKRGVYHRDQGGKPAATAAGKLLDAMRRTTDPDGLAALAALGERLTQGQAARLAAATAGPLLDALVLPKAPAALGTSCRRWPTGSPPGTSWPC
jgi:hypothetical protein